MFDNNVLNLFPLLSASDNEGKELNATFKTSIHRMQIWRASRPARV